MQNQGSLKIFKNILYVLAGLLLGLGLVVGIGLIAGAANVQNALMPLQFMGGEVFANLVAPYLRGLLNGLGVFSLVITMVLSLLLFSAGQLLGYITSLEARLAALEEQ